MKLFVDDIRACPEGWILARTITEAIRYLATWSIEEISLDHDIQCDPPNGSLPHASWETFEPVARYIALMPKRPKVSIHTANFPAGDKMADILGITYYWPEGI